MACRKSLVLLLWSWMLAAANGVLIKPRIYEIRNINSTCTSQEMKIRLEVNRNFQGVVYAKGFPLEKNCRSLGTGENFMEITIDTSGCGVRLVSIDDKTLTFRVTLNVQMDKFLQQITDIEVSATCTLSFNDMVYPKQAVYNRQISRTGRNKVADVDIESQNKPLSDIKTWMEIEGTSELHNINKVSVGEQTMVLIKSFLPESLAANVIDCYAYDGTRDVAQKLIDENGCPIDETIMPSLEVIKFEDEGHVGGDNEITWEEGTDAASKRQDLNLREKLEKAKSERNKKTLVKTKQRKVALVDSENVEIIPEKEKTRIQVIGTMFSAFKFPDTANLHLRCSLQICRKACPSVSCEANSGLVSNRSGKAIKSNNSSSSVIEKIEVFNSVEVVAPGIDSDGYLFSQDGGDSEVKSEGKMFCLSASKMAFSFAILGAVFLCGVLAALWTVMRNHLRKASKIDGSEQILVVGDSSLNFVSSRNKMYQSWTYS